MEDDGTCGDEDRDELTDYRESDHGSDNGSEAPPIGRHLRRRIAVQTKLEIVEMLDQKSERTLARAYGVSRSSIQRWKTQRAKLQLLNSSACRLPGGGGKIVGAELHEALVERVLFERSAQRRVSRSTLLIWAREMQQTMNVDIVVGSSWLDRFLHREGFVLRKATRKPVLSDDEIVTRGVQFIGEIRAAMERHDIDPSRVFNLGETAVFFDHSKQTTVHQRGARDVPIKSLGFEKQRVTAVFCASATGGKLAPCVMSKQPPVAGETPVAMRDGVMQLRMGTAWMNSSAFIAYLDFVFPPPIAPWTTLLVFDCTRCHTAQAVLDYLTSRCIAFVVVPGGMTGFCQPADFGWFAQLKRRLADSIDTWKRDGPHSFTRGGRVRPQTSDIVSRWLLTAWDAVNPSSAVASFVRCVLGQDDELHLSSHERLGVQFLDALRSSQPAPSHLSLQHLGRKVQHEILKFDSLVNVDVNH